MKGIFLCAYKQRHYNYDIDYNDIVAVDGINILGSCEDVDISNYDYLLATLPCNYYSICNYRRDESEYALKTKHLLPTLLVKFSESGKPFLIENVRNDPLFIKCGIYDIVNKYNLFVQTVGRHTYFSNVYVRLDCPQIYDFKYHGIKLHKDVQGGENTFKCFEIWLELLYN